MKQWTEMTCNLITSPFKPLTWEEKEGRGVCRASSRSWDWLLQKMWTCPSLFPEVTCRPDISAVKRLHMTSWIIWVLTSWTSISYITFRPMRASSKGVTFLSCINEKIKGEMPPARPKCTVAIKCAGGEHIDAWPLPMTTSPSCFRDCSIYKNKR